MYKTISELLLSVAVFTPALMGQTASGNVAESPNAVVLAEQSQNFTGLSLQGCLLDRGAVSVLLSSKGETLVLAGDQDFAEFVGRYVRVFGSESGSEKDLKGAARHVGADARVFVVKRLDLISEYCPR